MEKAPLVSPIRSWRYVVIVGLLVLPITVLFVAGALTLAQQGRLWWFWWFGPACWGTAYLLTRLWRRRLAPVPDRGTELPPYWTPRDKQAWQLVQQQQEAIQHVHPDRLTDPHFYLQSAMDLGRAVARDYHPRSKDPFGSVTVPEILAAAVLAVEDTAVAFDKYVPGGHLATVNQWRTLARSPKWIRAARDTWWVVSLVWNPWNVARFIASRLAMESASRQLQENASAWFYMVFVRHIGFYLIEMNSGRLRAGIDRYREFRRRLDISPTAESSPESTGMAAGGETSEEQLGENITIAVIGKVNAGKSSLVNALTGEQQAAVDVLPQTKAVARYQLQLAGTAHQLVLLDTPGYGDDGATPAQKRDMEAAFGQADLVLLLMDVSNPARQADVKVAQALLDSYLDRAPRKPPPVIGVLSHIDNLSPSLEWKPPYNWQEPTTPKERNIADAVQFNRGQLGPLVATMIPVCTDVEHGRAFGVDEQLLPAILSVLGEARACALLRTLHRDLDGGQVQQLLRQLTQAGLGLLQAYVLGEFPRGSGYLPPKG